MKQNRPEIFVGVSGIIAVSIYRVIGTSSCAIKTGRNTKFPDKICEIYSYVFDIRLQLLPSSSEHDHLLQWRVLPILRELNHTKQIWN